MTIVYLDKPFRIDSYFSVDLMVLRSYRISDRRVEYRVSVRRNRSATSNDLYVPKPTMGSDRLGPRR